MKPALRACPFCAEQINAEAIVCRFCQRDVTPIAPAVIIATRHRGYGRTWLWLSLGLGFFAVVALFNYILNQPAESAATRQETAPSSRPDFNKRAIYNALLLGSSTSDVATRYNTTTAAVEAIAAEGKQAGWKLERAAGPETEAEQKAREIDDSMSDLRRAGVVVDHDCTRHEVQIAFQSWLAMDLLEKRHVGFIASEWCADNGSSDEIKLIDSNNGHTLARASKSGVDVY